MLDFSDFYKLSVEQRQQRINVSLSQNLSLETADSMIENLVTTLGLPVGVACHFVIDNQPVWIPMAIEEPSVIAAASHMAKLAALRGGFKTHADLPIMIGQIQLLGSPDWDHVKQVIDAQRSELIKIANTYCKNLVLRGGGCENLRLKNLSPNMAVLEVLINCQDAMGANLINTMMEGLAPKIEELTGAKAGFKILSNLCDQRLARARCEIPYAALAMDKTHDQGRAIAQRMVLGYEFACLDPYRGCTHNKGIMNGVDAVVIATGNDWRAVEAGAHAYASQKQGGYGPLTHLELNDEEVCLSASIELPLALGVVGGITQTHPTVKACLELLGDFGKSSRALAGLVASVGLAQNLGAMRALAAEGIQKGHMALHHRKQF
ncbi:MAG: hydroxymethylglutaryl-CoA reductase, degradative [Myxococcaceae bacterium]